ncbi:hypothetical protein D3C72_1797830 [compost metagenome]
MWIFGVAEKIHHSFFCKVTDVDKTSVDCSDRFYKLGISTIGVQIAFDTLVEKFSNFGHFQKISDDYNLDILMLIYQILYQGVHFR